jgi:hypothetical protein
MMSRLALVPTLLLASACAAASGAPENTANANAGANLVAPAQPAGPGNVAPAGHYRLRGGHDTASELDLLPDGRFRFFFAAGALDLHAEGRWTSDGHTVVLNTAPRPTPAAFTAGPVTRTDDSPIVVLVNGPNGRGIAGVDLKMGFADGREFESYTQDYGWRYDQEGPPGVPRWVELSLRMYDLPPQRFALDAAAGNKFTFTLVPNDLGVQDFRDTALQVTGDGLVITGPGGNGIYARENRGE